MIIHKYMKLLMPKINYYLGPFVNSLIYLVEAVSTDQYSFLCFSLLFFLLVV